MDGYSNLRDYCIEELGFTEGAAGLRIRVARICQKHSIVLDALAAQQISLTVAGKIATHITDENRERLIADCSGMSKSQVMEYLARHFLKATEDSVSMHGVITPIGPDLSRLKFNAHKRFVHKLRRVAELGRFGDAAANMRVIFEDLMDEWVIKHDPILRAGRRKETPPEKPAEKTAPTKPRPNPSGKRPRKKIPIARRDEVINRDDHQCTYVSPNGRRCKERCYIEVDHADPHCKGGSDETDNLRVLCKPHNALLAELLLGEEFMRNKISQAQQDRQAKTALNCVGKSRPDAIRPDWPDSVREPTPTYGIKRFPAFASPQAHRGCRSEAPNCTRQSPTRSSAPPSFLWDPDTTGSFLVAHVLLSKCPNWVHHTTTSDS